MAGRFRHRVTEQCVYLHSEFHRERAGDRRLTAFITGFALNGPSLRNDFSGWVGMSLTVGGSALSVPALGRICLAGNSGTHTIKFVNAGPAADVAGSSPSVNMAGCTAGQFVYGSLPISITLQASTSYYVVTQESTGEIGGMTQGAPTTSSQQ